MQGRARRKTAVIRSQSSASHPLSSLRLLCFTVEQCIDEDLCGTGSALRSEPPDMQ